MLVISVSVTWVRKVDEVILEDDTILIKPFWEVLVGESHETLL